jgi:dTDP-4-dehydrorhamnose 3,5-epimerase
MRVIESKLPGILIIEPKVMGDPRGFFMESYHELRYRECGIGTKFVQHNISKSMGNVLRGLHFQNPNPQGKLIEVLWGQVYDVAVDIRLHSPTFGKWLGVTLSSENKRQVYIPPDYAHGLLVTGEGAILSYKCTDYYHPESESAIAWNDPTIAIDWPTTVPPVLSEKDRTSPTLLEMDRSLLPLYRGKTS